MIRQLILRLLRTQDKRLEGVENAQDALQKTMNEVKSLLVDLNAKHGELHRDVLQSTDEHGQAIRRLQSTAFDAEKRLVTLERESGRVDELEGRLLRLESGPNAAE